jgi:hypothetical protein
MATSRPFAYNPTQNPITGTNQVGDLAIGVDPLDYSENPGGVIWVNGPDEELGYVIAHTVPTCGQPSPTGNDKCVGFNRTTGFTDESFIVLSEQVSTKYSTHQTFSSATQASIWLTNNGFWNTYVLPVLSLDAGDPLSYSGSGSIWTDLISGVTFELFNGPTYDSGNGGKIYFSANSGQYARSNVSLPSLTNWTVSVWHYWDGTNTSLSPCIVTELWPNTTNNLNYNIGSLNDNNPNLQAGFFDGAWRTTPTGYSLSANNWYNIVGTYDGSTIKLFVNNSLVQSTSYVGTPISGSDGIILMRRWDNPPGGFWGGYLSTLNIYDKALTDVQIGSMWNSTKSRFGL